MLVKIYRKTDREKEYNTLIKANKQFPDHYLIMFELTNLMCFKTGKKNKGLNYLRNVFKNFQLLMLLGQVSGVLT